MLVRDFLAKTDIEKAVLYMRSHNNRIEDPYCTGAVDEHHSEKEWEEIQVNRFKDFVARLLKMPPLTADTSGHIIVPSNRSSAHSDNIILGMPRRDSASEPEAEWIDLSVFKKSNLVKWRKTILQYRQLPDPDTLSDTDVSRLADELRQKSGGELEDAPYGEAFEFAPWEKVLGWEVDRKNIILCGEDAFAAELLSEMSFNGIFPEQQEARRESLMDSVREAERIFDLPEDEQEEYSVDAAELFTDILKEAGAEYIPQTQEEKEAMYRQMNRDMLYNHRFMGLYLDAYLNSATEKMEEYRNV